jgi:hypothetical protein
MMSLRWHPGPRMRKTLLLLHILSSGAWLGIDVVLGILVFTAMLSGDSSVAASAIGSTGHFATWPLALTGLLCLFSGVLLSTGSKYGLVRYWWVAVKLVLNVVLVTLVLVLLMPTLGPLAAEARSGGPLPEIGDLAYPPIVSTVAVLVAMTLSVFKPWGRVRSGPR